MIDVKKVRKDFLVYENNPNMVYMDSAASALKVKYAVEAMDFYHNHLGVNVHRGSHYLTFEATRLYEDARNEIAAFLNASSNEIVFTRGTTTALNIVAKGYLDKLNSNDEIIVSELEHHSSILPWMNVSKRTGAKLKYVPLENNRITVESFKKVLTSNTKVVALTYVSNVLGYITPIKEIIELAHSVGAIVIVDAAQAVPHLEIDVKDLNCDFLAFSGHKVYGPSGIGVLFGKEKLLNNLEPFEYGGEMALDVDLEHATYKDVPYRFEAGTPIIAGAIGLPKALNYIKELGYENIHSHIETLRKYIVDELSKLEGITIYNKDSDVGIITLNIDDVHPHDVATVLDQYGVAARSGHHCAQLVSKLLNVDSTLRLSLNIYNDKSDCDKTIEAIKSARDFFKSF